MESMTSGRYFVKNCLHDGTEAHNWDKVNSVPSEKEAPRMVLTMPRYSSVALLTHTTHPYHCSGCISVFVREKLVLRAYSSVIILSKNISVVGPHTTGDAGAEAGTEQHNQYDVLLSWQVEAGHRLDWKQDYSKVGDCVDQSGCEQVGGFVNAVLRRE